MKLRNLFVAGCIVAFGIYIEAYENPLYLLAFVAAILFVLSKDLGKVE